MRRNLAPQRRFRALPFILIGIIVAIAALGLAFAGRSVPLAGAPQPTAEHFVDTTQPDHHATTGERTVVIARLGEQVPGISGQTGPLMTTLVSGQYPEGATQATVRTDENCAADQDGVSHCLNELDFGTSKVIVQHHHAMARTSCLTPGEVVTIMTMTQFNAQS